MKNYDFKLKMKTLWMWRASESWIRVSHKEPRPVDPAYGWNERWRPYPNTYVSVCKKGISNFLSKPPKDPRELWQINPNGEVIVWEWTP